jgi:uncharacterized membrane protein
LTKGSLKVVESRVIASLLLQGTDDAAWRRAIVDENVLQKRSPSAATTIASLIEQRLRTMTPDLWRIIQNGSTTVATQATLAAAIKHNRLIGDFLNQTLRERLRQFQTNLSESDWEEYIRGVQERDENAATWTAPVLDKLRQCLFRVLAEAGYVSDTRTLTIQRITVAHDVRHYLEENGEDYVLRCMRVAE